MIIILEGLQQNIFTKSELHLISYNNPFTTNRDLPKNIHHYQYETKISISSIQKNIYMKQRYYNHLLCVVIHENNKNSSMKHGYKAWIELTCHIIKKIEKDHR